VGFAESRAGPFTHTEPKHMTATAATAATITKGTRRASTILTDRACEKRVTKREKFYDRKCPGLYVSIIPTGVATFNFKFTDGTTGKQRSTVMAVYNPETFAVDAARRKVYALKAMSPAALVEQLSQTKAVQTARGKTVAEIVEERIGWMKMKVRKADGEMRPRIE
jgi:hypothetical protein